MVSDLFMRDYAAMEAAGVKLSPADIIRLNALALKVSLTSDMSGALHLPRLVFLPRDSRWHRPLVMREPTIGHDLWLESLGRYVDVDNAAANRLTVAYALTRHLDELPDADDPAKCLALVARFAAKRLVNFTAGLIDQAIDYAVSGADWMAAERGPRSAKAEKALSAERERGLDARSATLGVLCEGRAIGLGISLADARTMTASELMVATDRAWAISRKLDYEAMKNQALGEYVRAKREVVTKGGGHDI